MIFIIDVTILYVVESTFFFAEVDMEFVAQILFVFDWKVNSLLLVSFFDHCDQKIFISIV